MKFSTALFASSLMGVTSAFVTNSPSRSSCGPLAANSEEEKGPVVFSTALPFMERPPLLDGSMAGDVGFDPLNFAQGEGELRSYREAEIKHSRLAMLAAAGWPLSELLDKKIAAAFNLTPLLDATDRVPSLLNGGLGKVSPVYWVVVLVFAGIIDFNGTNRATFAVEEGKGYSPGNLAFDPLGLYPKNEDEQMYMQTAEIKHGRVAMVAVVAYAIEEYVFKKGIVDETPFLFTFPWN
jgi:hypothetical protein